MRPNTQVESWPYISTGYEAESKGTDAYMAVDFILKIWHALLFLFSQSNKGIN